MLQITPRALRMIRDAQTKSEERLRAAGIAAREAVRKPRQINRDRRQHLIQLAADILKRGTSSKFEFEASCHSGIRQSLCLQGWSWADADLAAADVVGSALNQIGAVRPTWYEGQPEWTQPAYSPVERVLCERCATRIPHGRGDGTGTAARYCSDLCSRAARTDRHKRLSRLFGDATREIAVAAYQANRRDAAADARIRACEGCGETYENTDGSSRFCSRKCANQNAKSRVEKIDLRCDVCRKAFVAKAGTRYCGAGCRNRAYRQRFKEQASTQQCLACGETFQPDRKGVRFCNLVCAAAYRNAGLSDRSCDTCKSIFRPRGPFDKRRYCSKRCQPGGFAKRAAVAALPLAPDQLKPMPSPFQCTEVKP